MLKLISVITDGVHCLTSGISLSGTKVTLNGFTATKQRAIKSAVALLYCLQHFQLLIASVCSLKLLAFTNLN